jgi:hypothetical protein
MFCFMNQSDPKSAVKSAVGIRKYGCAGNAELVQEIDKTTFDQAIHRLGVSGANKMKATEW